MKEVIKFGTDGWRGVIGEDFHFRNVLRVAEGLNGYLRHELKKTAGNVIIGYDCRFLSDEAAGVAACWLKEQGHHVTLATTPIPTPAVSMMVRNRGADAGLMITASHNPALYNGIKFKGSYGGSFMEEMIQQVSQHVPATTALHEKNVYAWLQESLSKVNREDLGADYYNNLMKFMQIDSLKGMRFVVDPMHGAGSGFLKRALTALGAEVVEIRGERNPLFGGIHPEPLDKTTPGLRQAVLDMKAHAGFILDGDSDRIGARDEKGEFVDSHRIFSLLLRHMVENRRADGKVLKTISTTDMVDQLCKQYNLPCQTTPVGFKHICTVMLKEKSLMGGEESGGIGFASYLPERDGALCALLLAEMLVKSNKNGEKSFSAHINQLMRDLGPHSFRRFDMTTPIGKALPVIEAMKKQAPTTINGRKVIHIDQLDGIKLRFQSSWLMFRGSGTEPLLRMYAEAPSLGEADQLIADGTNWARGLLA